MVEIRGLQKTSLVDYPPNIACTVFLGGCNFRCKFCHNPDIVFNKPAMIEEEEFFKFLEERKNLLDGVCVTGGEPTLHKYLPEFLMKIKKKGMLVKLDTNGSNPEMLRNIIDNKLVDRIAMDIKGPLEDYEKICGCKVDTEKIKESIELVKKVFDHEFRLTVVPQFINKENIVKIGELLKGAKRLFLQQFVSSVDLVDNSLKGKKPHSVEELSEMKKILEPYFYRVGVRGV
ncbi:anaerobic ribonucleoside-triphosphate reductase activating protein [Candidatus Woesearchaeota archaeon]|nr:anaerobic ribonucleoside-triphosphate reductase activating protein [Candidatus Woesearchaeota archaeon]